MTFQGIPVSPGIAVGKALRFTPDTIQVEQRSIPAEDIKPALARLQRARETAVAELDAIRAKLQPADPDKADIFTAQIDLLSDPIVEEEIRELVQKKQVSVEWAIETVYGKYIQLLGATGDTLIRQRTADMRDVRNRLLRSCLCLPQDSPPVLHEPVILVARDLLPSEVAALDRDNVLAIVTEIGGVLSHTAILAKSFGIPALVGAAGVMGQVKTGQALVVDCTEGLLLVEPGKEEQREYRQKARKLQREAEQDAGHQALEAQTSDGERVWVELNITTGTRDELEAAAYTDGVGLFRTEFLFMGRATLPEEEEQLAAYKRVLLAFGERPVVLRTLDIGGDKPISAVPGTREKNPLLGNRALRFCFQHPEVFHTQLRAALRAAVAGNLRIMFPMVTTLEDMRQARALVQRAIDSLQADGLEYRQVPLGAMIETPALAVMADALANEVDFASIGTNDLCQYTMAADRQNPLSEGYYQEYHPAMLRLLRFVAESFAKAGKPLAVCGEMGGDPLALPLLLGFGIKHFSMGKASIGRCKRALRRITTQQAQAWALEASGMAGAAEIKEYLAAQATML